MLVQVVPLDASPVQCFQVQWHTSNCRLAAVASSRQDQKKRLVLRLFSVILFASRALIIFPFVALSLSNCCSCLAEQQTSSPMQTRLALMRRLGVMICHLLSSSTDELLFEDLLTTSEHQIGLAAVTSASLGPNHWP